jgi:hypothetical protein
MRIMTGRGSVGFLDDRPRPGRRLLVAPVCALFLLGASSCTIDVVRPPAGPQPEVSIKCPEGFVDITVKNVSDRPARYVVSVDITFLGTTTTEQFSSNTVAAGQVAVIHDSRIQSDGTCTVSEVRVFDAE